MSIFSISEAITKLAEMSIAVHVEEERTLTRAAKIVQAEAKREIGNYQDEASPFAGWAELADSTKADRLKQGFTENDPLLRSGDLLNSIDIAVDASIAGNGEAVIGSNSQIAVYQELGTSKMPPRSFLGGALVRKTDEVVLILGAGTYGALIGEDVVGKSLGLISGGATVP